MKKSILQILLLLLISAVFILTGGVFIYSSQHNLTSIAGLIGIAIILALLFCLLLIRYFKRYQLLENQHNLLEVQLKNVIASSKELRDKLTYEMQELGIHNEKMTLLIDLSEMVQACNTIPEAIKAIETKCKKILHFVDGTLYIMNRETNFLDLMLSWGEPLPQIPAITPDQCWALRRGGIYQIKNPQTDLICTHIDSNDIGSYLCIPLMAQNSIIGLLHLNLPEDIIDLTPENRILISAVAETLALALANINLRETLRNQSLHDSLTGLYNKRYLNEFLPKALNLAWRNQSNLAILMIDIDFFKQFNDEFGHEAGDLMLAELGKLFQSEMRTSDVCCRYGGEEFLCVLQHCQLTDAKKRANEIRETISKIRIAYKDKEINGITISIGIAIYPDSGTTMTELIEAADKALYAAKNAGRNKVISDARLMI